jgi:hypothetical protein
MGHLFRGGRAGGGIKLNNDTMKKRFTILSILLCILMISGAAMTATHAAKKKKIRHKQTPEQLFSLKKSDLDGLLIPAAEYGVEYGFLADYGFILYNNGGIPTPVVFETYIDEDGYDREAVVGQVPVEERKIDTRYLYEEDERLSDLTRVVETLSAHRAQIDFEALYRDFGWILRKALSRADYEKRYAPTVEMLLAVYDDLRANAELYGVTEAVMQAHWEQTLDNSYVGLPD